MKPLRIIIGCERSGVVREAFRKLGHDAWSCDLEPADDGSPYHLQGDILGFLGLGWDCGLFHPPCDYLTVSGNGWFSDTAKAKAGTLTGQARRDARDKAVEFVKALWAAQIQAVAIENPIGRLSTLWQKPTQTIQPWHHGEKAFKGTCLWLRGLPPLKDSNRLTPPAKGTEEFRAWSHLHYLPPSKDRKRLRSVTFQGIANSMAAQWSAHLTQGNNALDNSKTQ